LLIFLRKACRRVFSIKETQSKVKKAILEIANYSSSGRLQVMILSGERAEGGWGSGPLRTSSH
jgi:hypothetical protein